jgi:glycerol uptake facilitator-like aquaporin
VSTRELTIATAWIAVLAIVALVAAGWRKPARATANPARALLPRRARVGLPVTADDVPLDRHMQWWRKIWVVVAGSAMAGVAGAIVATLVGFGASWIVITLSHTLKK